MNIWHSRGRESKNGLLFLHIQNKYKGQTSLHYQDRSPVGCGYWDLNATPICTSYRSTSISRYEGIQLYTFLHKFLLWMVLRTHLIFFFCILCALFLAPLFCYLNGLWAAGVVESESEMVLFVWFWAIPLIFRILLAKLPFLCVFEMFCLLATCLILNSVACKSFFFIFRDPSEAQRELWMCIWHSDGRQLVIRRIARVISYARNHSDVCIPIQRTSTCLSCSIMERWVCPFWFQCSGRPEKLVNVSPMHGHRHDASIHRFPMGTGTFRWVTNCIARYIAMIVAHVKRQTSSFVIAI